MGLYRYKTLCWCLRHAPNLLKVTGVFQLIRVGFGPDPNCFAELGPWWIILIHEYIQDNCNLFTNRKRTIFFPPNKLLVMNYLPRSTKFLSHCGFSELFIAIIWQCINMGSLSPSLFYFALTNAQTLFFPSNITCCLQLNVPTCPQNNTSGMP